MIKSRKKKLVVHVEFREEECIGLYGFGGNAKIKA
jgi:hypothetical protein